jgi:RNA polymerase sigma factor (TIGR02999 family)
VQFSGEIAHAAEEKVAWSPRREGVIRQRRNHLRFNDLTSTRRAGTFSTKTPVPDPTQAVSELLARWRAGDEESLRQLVPLVYNQLRRLAHYQLRKERPGHTLQSTGLVHEAYLRLVKQEPMLFENRAHFYAVCAQLMRQILVQYARRQKAAKRYGGTRVTLDDAIMLTKSRSVDLIALDDALDSLSKLDAQQSRIVELRFFGGLSIEETANVLSVSPATVERHWTTARVWLHKQISRVESHDA